MEMFTSITKMKVEDLMDPDIMKQKQEQIANSLEKFKKHFVKNLDQLNEKEVHKKVSPKFTVCFMDLASYLNISLKPIVESAHQAHFNEESDFKEMQTKSQLERHQQPSVIKEEIEDDDLEETFHNTLRTSKSKPGRNKIINVEASSRHNTAPKYEPIAPKYEDSEH